MGYVKMVMLYSLLGLPVWSWLVGGAIVGAQELMNRSKRFKAQTYAQAVGNVFALVQKSVLGRFPVVGQVLALIAMLQTPPPAPALAESAEKKAVGQ